MSPDFQLLRVLAGYAAVAYTTTDLITDAATNAAAVVTMDDSGNLIVAFRGSQAPVDFIQDAKFAMEKLIVLSGGNEAFVHKGFLEDFNAIDVAVVREVKRMLALNPAAKVYITGHSLGGGLAILSALELCRSGIRVDQVVTFGQPRVGNSVFAEMYNMAQTTDGQFLGDRTFHVINAADPVPLLPPLLNGYRDEGQEIFLPAAGAPQLNPSIGLTIFNDVLGVFDSWRQLKLALLPHHFLKAYQARIQLL